MPVVAMTAHAMKEECDRCLALGMNGHIAKPIDIDELHAALGRWLPTTLVVEEEFISLTD